MEAVREKEVKLQGVGFVKQVGFKPGVKGRKFNLDQVIHSKAYISCLLAKP